MKNGTFFNPSSDPKKKRKGNAGNTSEMRNKEMKRENTFDLFFLFLCFFHAFRSRTEGKRVAKKWK